MNLKIIKNKIQFGKFTIELPCSVNKSFLFKDMLVVYLLSENMEEYERLKNIDYSSIYGIDINKGEIIWQWPYKGVANIWKDEENPELLVIWNGAACYTAWVNPQTGETLRQQAEK